MPVELRIGTPRAELAPSPEEKAPSLKLLFNGQGQGAADVLKLLQDRGHQIVGVVTTKYDDPVRTVAQEVGFPIINLGTVNSDRSKEIMRGWNADLGVGFFLQAKLDQGVYSIPEYGTMNFHLSPLPKRRGRDSMNWGIRDGDKILGASWFLMSKKIDAGPIVRQVTFKNNGNSQGSQYFEHLPEFVENTADAVDDMAWGIELRREDYKRKFVLPLVPQIPSQATEDPPLGLKHTRIRPNIMRADTSYNRVQAGGPGAWVMTENGRLFLSKPSIDSSGMVLKPGEVSVIDKGLAIGTKNGVLVAGAVGRGPRDRLPVQQFIEQNGPIKLQ